MVHEPAVRVIGQVYCPEACLQESPEKIARGNFSPQLLRGMGRRLTAEEEGCYENMKKFLGKVIMKIIFSERYLAERLEEQGTKDQGKQILPKLVGLGPVLGQWLITEQETF
jgi:hypothetical protein